MKQGARKLVARQEPSMVQVSLPRMGELRGLLLELVISSGLDVVGAMLEADREELCGPRYARVAARDAHRFGYASGELALGGRRVQVRRPRARSCDGRELPLPTWQQLSSEDPLRERAMEQMLVGVTTRKYHRSLEAMPKGVAERGVGKSSVSRRFVAATKEQVQSFLGRDLSELRSVTLMIDGLAIDEHAVLIALGIDEKGFKHVLGVHEGATENSASCKALLEDLAERGLDTSRKVLVVIDGAKALRKAVRNVFGEAAQVQRCQVHKMRNVTEHLPERDRARVAARMREAYGSGDADRAKRLLLGLARQLEVSHPGAAGSLREGLDETLTVMRLGITGALLRTLASTNVIENLNGLLRVRLRNVRRWRNGSMVLRWVVAALDDAKSCFRRVRGHAQIQQLITALNRTANDSIDQISKAA
jgi:putative transposase